MTEVTATVSGNSRNHYRLEVVNHAGSHDACLMISAIVYALAGIIRTHPEIKVVYMDLEEGHSLVEYLSSDELGAEDFRMAVFGMLQVRKAYPNDLVVIENVFD